MHDRTCVVRVILFTQLRPQPLPESIVWLIFGSVHRRISDRWPRAVPRRSPECNCWSMPRVPRCFLGCCQRKPELLEGACTVFFLRIKPCIWVLLRNVCSEVSNLNRSITDVVIGRELIPVEHGELRTERPLVLAHVEE